MKFSKNYSKLKNKAFTTIRKNSGFYRQNSSIHISTPKENFMAEIVKIQPIKKESITEELAQRDADCSRTELIEMLEKWYGKKYNDFILINLWRT